MLVYKSLNGLAPSYLQKLVWPYTPSRQLRSCDQHLLRVPFTRSNVIKTRAFSVAGPQLWNVLPIDLRETVDVNAFKRGLKTYLFVEHFNN